MPTFKELHQQIAPEIKLRAWQIRVKNITGSYDGLRIATDREIAALTGHQPKRAAVKPAPEKATIQSGIYDDRQQLAAKVKPIAASVPAVASSNHIADVSNIVQPTNWQLWIVLVFSLACSIPNMYSIALQMKDTPELAAAITMTFTIAPLLLLNSHSKSARMAAFIPIAIEIMSNTVGYFGGLLRLTIGSDEIRPGRFLHLVANMFGTEYRPTALFLAIIFAASIAALSIISAHSIAKKA
jgi:hypothetical protein